MKNTYIKILCGVAIVTLPISIEANEQKVAKEDHAKTVEKTNNFIRLLKEIRVGTSLSKLKLIKGVKNKDFGGKPFYTIDSDGIRGFISLRDKKVHNVLVLVDNKEMVDMDALSKAVAKLYECKLTKGKRNIYEYEDEEILIEFYASKSGFGVECASK